MCFATVPKGNLLQFSQMLHVRSKCATHDACLQFCTALYIEQFLTAGAWRTPGSRCFEEKHIASTMLLHKLHYAFVPFIVALVALRLTVLFMTWPPLCCCWACAIAALPVLRSEVQLYCDHLLQEGPCWINIYLGWFLERFPSCTVPPPVAVARGPGSQSFNVVGGVAVIVLDRSF